MAAREEHSQLQRAARTILVRFPCGAEPRRVRRSGARNGCDSSTSVTARQRPAGRGRGRRGGCWEQREECRGSAGRIPRVSGEGAEGQREGCWEQREGCRGEEARLRALPGRAAQPPPRKFGGRSISASSFSRPLASHRHDFHGPCKAWHEKMLFPPLVPSLSLPTRSTRQRLLMVLEIRLRTFADQGAVIIKAVALTQTPLKITIF